MYVTHNVDGTNANTIRSTTMAAVTLTTPCTINQLMDFIEHQVAPVHANLEAGTSGTVTTTSSTLVVT